MTARDLPEFAIPWEDPLGVTWYCVPAPDSCFVIVHRFEEMTKTPYIGSGMAEFPWRVHPALLAGLGRTLPPVPTPKRVAKLVTRSDGAELAVKGDKLFYRRDRSPWKRYSEMLATMDFVAAAHAAFAGAGDVLPGEIPDA